MPEAPPSEVLAEVDPAAVRVLVAEDEAIVCQFLKEALTRSGYHVDTTHNGAEAVRLMEAEPYDVVVTDLRMPDEDGTAVLRMAKQVDPRTAVIIVSAYGTIESAVELMKQGADDFLPKPLSPERLSISVRRALRMRRLEDMARASQHFEKLSLTDDLTGLPNRRAFEDSLSREVKRSLRYGHALSALMVDLDHFKRINDTYGHAAGDELLRAVAKCLREAIREQDILARWGGEEFALLLPVTDEDDVLALGQRLVLAVREHPFRLSGVDEDVAITASAGGATLPTHAKAAPQLVHLADDHLYKAKRLGRDCCCTPEHG